MRIDKFTVKTQEAIAAAQGIAERLGQQAVDVEHVLLALLQQTEGAVVPIAQKIGADPQALGRELEAALEKLPRVSGGLTEKTYVTPRLAIILRAVSILFVISYSSKVSPVPHWKEGMYFGGRIAP